MTPPDFLRKVQDKTYTTKNLAEVDYWSLLYDQAVELGAKEGMPVNPAYQEALSAVKVTDAALGEISVFDLIRKRLEQMTQQMPAFDPFTGPQYDRKNTLRVPEGKRMTPQQLASMEWAARGVQGPWPNEP